MPVHCVALVSPVSIWQPIAAGVPVLIFGEPGLEKNNVASLVHFSSPDHAKPMIQVWLLAPPHAGTVLLVGVAAHEQPWVLRLAGPAAGRVLTVCFAMLCHHYC